MAGYVFQDYPKWIGDVVVQNEADERTHRAALAEAMGAVVAAQLPEPLSAAAIRMRRSRQRRRDGYRTIHFDISDPQLDALVQTGFVDAAKRSDASELASGLCCLIAVASRCTDPRDERAGK